MSRDSVVITQVGLESVMNTNKIISEINAEQMSKEIPAFAPGDTIVVQVKVKEGNRERLQAFEGVCIGKRNRGLNSAFTLRKISHGVGVERTFQTYSPLLDSITVKRRGDVRQAKLYYLRERSGRQRVSRKSCPANRCTLLARPPRSTGAAFRISEVHARICGVRVLLAECP